MHKTLYNISRGQVPSKHFIFISNGAPVYACAQWHNGQSNSACWWTTAPLHCYWRL